MARTTSVQSILRSAGLPAIALIAMGFFGYYAVLGPNGIFAWKEFREQTAQKNAEYADVAKQRDALRNRVGLLDKKGGADRDLADELVRKGLNVAGKDEIIVPLTNAKPAK